jgi:hypothetical protein
MSIGNKNLNPKQKINTFSQKEGKQPGSLTSIVPKNTKWNEEKSYSKFLRSKKPYSDPRTKDEKHLKDETKYQSLEEEIQDILQNISNYTTLEQKETLYESFNKKFPKSHENPKFIPIHIEIFKSYTEVRNLEKAREIYELTPKDCFSSEIHLMMLNYYYRNSYPQ